MTPKPPTPRSVSATLCAHDFRAVNGKRIEGYGVTIQDAGAVRVDFYVAEDGSEADQLHRDALGKMAAVLRRKGWLVEQFRGDADDQSRYLIVAEG
jgi:hypothetical protein